MVLAADRSAGVMTAIPIAIREGVAGTEVDRGRSPARGLVESVPSTSSAINPVHRGRSADFPHRACHRLTTGANQPTKLQGRRLEPANALPVDLEVQATWGAVQATVNTYMEPVMCAVEFTGRPVNQPIQPAPSRRVDRGP